MSPFRICIPWPLRTYFTIAILQVLFVPVCLTSFAQDQADQKAEINFTDQEIEFFESKIRPILVERCHECHGADAEYIEGGLNLASRKAILEGGDSGPAIDLQHVAESLIIDAINYGDLFEMPPDSKLPQTEIDLLTKWVEMGAPWPAESGENVFSKEVFDVEQRIAEHWCWQPIENPPIPDVQNQDWMNNEIDAFVLSKLESAKLKPAQPASQRQLIRRAYFDLIGLPPTPEQVEAFVNDSSEDAFEKVIDGLLESPHFGERWARHWMDLIRYAETYGHEFDYPIENAFRYRDYLIRAFNADVPYNQFIREHIAGDLLDSPRRDPRTRINESILGTGFWFLGEATHGPVDVKGDEAGRIDNQIDVMCKTFLGLTVACARCHDHKFDAISTKDYYSLAGFLQSSRRQDVMLDENRTIERYFEQQKDSLQELDELADQILSDFVSRPQTKDVDYLTAAIKAIVNNPSWLNVGTISIEAERMTVLERTGGTIQLQELRPQGELTWSGKKQLWWFEGKQGDEFTVEFELPFAATFDVVANFTTANDYGIWQLSIDNQVIVEEIDLYSKKLSKTGERSIGKLKLSAGKHQLKAKSIGTNPMAAPKYMFGLDYMKFVPQGANQADVNGQRLLNELADENQLDVKHLKSWINALADKRVAKSSHPMHAARALASKLSNADTSFESSVDSLRQELEQNNSLATQSRRSAKQFARFDEADFSNWFKTGFAFESRSEGMIGAEPAGSDLLARTDVAHSGRFGKRFYGVLRSPTFEIQHPHIHYRLLADNVQIRLIIDGFVLDIHNALLFNGMSFNISTGGEYIWRTQSNDLKNYIGHRAHIEIIDHGDGFAAVDEIWFSDGPAPIDFPSPVGLAVCKSTTLDDGDIRMFSEQLLSAMQQEASNNDRVEFANWFARHELAPTSFEKITELISVKSKLNKTQKSVPRPIMAIGMTDGSPENEFVFIRGNHTNIGDEVPRDMITALQPSSDQLFDNSIGSGRLYLADQIASSTNPLTTRVIVNRLWHHLMGRGLVPSVDNFGVLGEQPSHPELLDFLAARFVTDGWSIKQTLKTIMMSKTYQMSIAVNSRNEESDPGNLLLHRARIRRLQGEAIRDSILAVSGELNTEMFGPGIPIHLTPFMQGRGRPGKSGPLDGEGRRSIYTEVRRNFLPPMMLAFDTPIPFNAIGRRTESNVPAQALILMNNPFVIDQAKKWATKLVTEIPEVDARIRRIYLQAFAREPSSLELDAAKTFLHQQQTGTDTDASKSPGKISDDVAIWADYCHVIFNVKEFIFLY